MRPAQVYANTYLRMVTAAALRRLLLTVRINLLLSVALISPFANHSTAVLTPPTALWELPERVLFLITGFTACIKF